MNHRLVRSRRMLTLILLSLALVAMLGGCEKGDDDAPADGRDDRFVGAKADGFCVEPGSPEAAAILRWVDAATFAELDDPYDADAATGGAGLNRLAADGIVARRPFGGDLEALDAVPYVGNQACGLLQAHVCDRLGLCGGETTTCDPDAFEAPPDRTRFTATCLDALTRIRAVPEDTYVDTSPAIADRCEEASELDRRALDWALDAYGEPPSALVDAGNEVDIRHETRLVSDDARVDVERVDVVRIDSLNDGLQTWVVYENDAPLLMLTDDGLSTDEHWTCGGAGEDSIDAPWGPCAKAFFAPPCATTNETRMTIQPDAGSETPFRVRHALAHYMGGATRTEPIDVVVAGCEAAAVITIEATDGSRVSYDTRDDDAGTFLLTVTDESGTQVLCEADFES